MQKLMISIFCLLFANIQVHEAAAADIRPYIPSSGSYRAIVIEGNIEPGDFETFIRIIRENQAQIRTVYIFSSGGDFYEAMKIGRAMRALELHSQVPMLDPSGHPSCETIGFFPTPNDPKNCTCASAGFFIHIGGISRGGTFLAVHRPYFEKGRFGNLSQADAKKAFDTLQDSARDYMQEMGVPKHIQEDVLGTPSDRALILDEKTVKTYFWLELPYRHEWIQNRCSRLSATEEEKSSDYTRRIQHTPASNLPQALSKDEWADLDALQKKRTEGFNCAAAIGKQSRADAYERYFGGKPTDFGNHNFMKWSEAPKYLGKQFDELLGEEKFELKEEKLKSLEVSYLTRTATAASPYISLSDLDSKPKIVGSVSLIEPNPSPEFTLRLLQTLENAWGKHSGGDGSTEWIWNGNEFFAQLTYNPVSGEGPFLGLVIKAK